MATKRLKRRTTRSIGDFVGMRYGSRIRLAEVVGPERRLATGQRTMRVRLLSRVPTAEPVVFDVPVEWLEDVSQKLQREAKTLSRDAAAV